MIESLRTTQIALLIRNAGGGGGGSGGEVQKIFLQGSVQGKNV